jgi:hypothetical protein
MALPPDIEGRIAALSEPGMIVSLPCLPISPLRVGSSPQAMRVCPEPGQLLNWCDEQEAEAERLTCLN